MDRFVKAFEAKTIFLLEEHINNYAKEYDLNIVSVVEINSMSNNVNCTTYKIMVLFEK